MTMVLVETTSFTTLKHFISSVLTNGTTRNQRNVGNLSACEIFDEYSNILLVEVQEQDPRRSVLILRTGDIDCAQSTASQNGIPILEEFVTSSGHRLCYFQTDELDMYVVQTASQCESVSVAQVYLEYTSRTLGNASVTDSESALDSSDPAGNTIPAWNPPTGTRLSSIRLNLLHNGVYQPMRANADSAVPFSSDLFEGKVQLLVNSTEEHREPFVSIFRTNKYRFELQIQGRFKQVPSGQLFFGGEITKKMELGMITRGICAGLLQLCRGVNAYMHHSFGDKDNFELPHIVGPFWSTVDRLVVTPAGTEPPPFLESFPEDPKRRRERKAIPAYTQEVNLASTYSFSLKTNVMNLEAWAIDSSSYVKAMDLHTFWADADLRFACYCVPADAEGVQWQSNGLPKLHPQRQLQQFFNLEIQHVSNHPEWPEDDGLSAGAVRTTAATAPEERGATPTIQMAREGEDGDHMPSSRGSIASSGEDRDSSDNDNDDDDDDDDDDVEFYDAAEGSHHADSGYASGAALSDRELHAEKRRVSALLDDSLSALRERMPPQTENRTVHATTLGHSLVPAIIDTEDQRPGKRGRRRTMYAFLANPASDAYVAGGGLSTVGRKLVLHSYGEWKSALRLFKLPPQPPCYARYSDDMKRRVHLAWSYDRILSSAQNTGALRGPLEAFLADTSHHAGFLSLNGHGVSAKRLRQDLPSDMILECMACVQQGNHSWSEEWVLITSEQLIFVNSSHKLGFAGKFLGIPLRDVHSVHPVAEADNPLPLPDCYGFVVATFARQFTVMVRGAELRDRYVDELRNGAAAAHARDPLGTQSISSLRRPDAADAAEFSLPDMLASSLDGVIAYPPDWQLGDRLILNGRTFTCYGMHHQIGRRNQELVELRRNPCVLVERLLEMAYTLARYARAENATELFAAPDTMEKDVYQRFSHRQTTAAVDPKELWMDFMDGVALLQCIDLSILDNTSPEAACLFMNLYHCMLLHAYMVVGLPNSIFKWSNFFRHCSYEAFGDIFSLAELEHCIMRAGERPACAHSPLFACITQCECMRLNNPLVSQSLMADHSCSQSHRVCRDVATQHHVPGAALPDPRSRVLLRAAGARLPALVGHLLRRHVQRVRDPDLPTGTAGRSAR